MKLTVVFKDAHLPKKINFEARDLFEREKIINEAARLLRERFGEVKRKYDVTYKY